PDDSVELSWTSASLGQEHDAAKRDVIVAARLTTPPDGNRPALPALSAAQLLSALGSPNVTVTPPSVRLAWRSDELVVIATGFCKAADAAACTERDALDRNQMQIVELRAYVP